MLIKDIMRDPPISKIIIFSPLVGQLCRAFKSYHGNLFIEHPLVGLDHTCAGLMNCSYNWNEILPENYVYLSWGGVGLT
jgi:hypothetical protein